EREGRQVYYQVNSEHPLYPELSSLFRKSVGLADRVRSALSGLDNQLKIVAIFGSMASGSFGPQSDVDLLVVGQVEFAEVVGALGEVQMELGREINPVVLSVNELRSKVSAKDRFMVEILDGDLIWIKGSRDELGKLVEDRAAEKTSD
uniref:nucleotidyltransferase domain-containing protein n=1 Tax=Sedimenticola sp. TaxID=1940285 RepID=UPI003D13E25D